MSMTVYPITGAPVSLDATDNKNATGIVAAGSGGGPDMYGVSLAVSQDREVTKAGATRVMIRVSAKTPFGGPITSAGYNDVEMGEVSAHCVLTVPKNMANALQFEVVGQSQTTQVCEVIRWLSAVLTAVINDKSLPALPSVANFAELPLVQAIVGKMPLDVQSGTYGSAS